MNKNNMQYFGKWLSGLFFLLLSFATFAEDIEIFSDDIPPAKPNILMVLDHSGSMNITVSGGTQTRLGALRTAFNSLMTDTDFAGVKVGLMGFSNGSSIPYPHGMSFPVTDLDDLAEPIMLSNLIPFRPRMMSDAGGGPTPTVVGYFTLADDVLPDPVPGDRVRDFLPKILNGWNAWGSTPLVDAYYEAALYFRGEKPKWGLATPEQNHAAHPSTYKGLSAGTVTQVPTGSTLTCDAPDCGINCVSVLQQGLCATGQASCGLGTNCITATETWTATCTLPTEAECLASDTRFTSCVPSGYSSCSTSCISGVYHPETGLCIPDALSSFTIKTHAANMCLEMNGSALTQELCDGSPEQVFYSTAARPGFVNIAGSNNYCIDVQASDDDDLTPIIAHPCSSPVSSNQTFSLSGGNIIAEHSGKCLDIPGAAYVPGVGVTQYTCNGTAHQTFTMSNEATSCTVSNDYWCQFPQETTRCDHQKYTCDETRAEATLDSDNIIYNSPISDECENNAIVLLSDGQPYVPDRLQFDQTMVDVKTMTGSTVDCVDTSDGRCGTEIASFLATKDQSSVIDGDNFINTYTIGFDVSAGSAAEVFLKSVANAGEGQYFPASDAAALAAVFKSIVSDVSKAARSYSAPAYTVDQSSLLSHSRNVYIPMFENAAAPAWSGNLKKFKLNDSGQIIDKTGKVAVDQYGVLDAEAIDFWGERVTSTRRGRAPNPVTTGGVASRLDPDSRKLLTDNGTALVSLDATSVTKTAMSGGAVTISDAEHAAMLKFIQGYEDDGKARHHLGDILHSKPMVVSYGAQEVIFFGTNEGFLHAINANDADVTGGGKELFAYMPSSLLSTIPGQYENTPLSGSIKRIYGVDGEMTVWLDDKNKNGRVDSGSGESAYLFFGLRRGGNAYYALNITDPSNPALMWSINNNTAGFGQLAQSWSKPVPARLRYKDSGDVKYEEVLIFGGGYDAAIYDEANASSRNMANVKGNAIYIVNAKTGALIWSHSGGDLQHSVAGNIRVLDLDRNGSIDRLYFGDLGGNVWRADLNVDDIDDDASLNDVKKDARIYRLADLGGSTGSANHRMFFYEPDVSVFKHKGQLMTIVAIGSGYRAHPKDTSIQDRFYVLRDENAVNVPKTAPVAMTHSDLMVSSSLGGSDFMPDYKGWYMDLTNHIGEKSLSSPLIFVNKVMFTTFGFTSAPVSTVNADNCGSKSSNLSRAYVLDLMKASATVDLNGDGNITDADRSVMVGTGDIPDSPKLVFNEPTNCDKKGCDQFVDVRVGKMQTPLIDRNTSGGNVNLGDILPKVFWLDTEQ